MEQEEAEQVKKDAGTTREELETSGGKKMLTEEEESVEQQEAEHVEILEEGKKDAGTKGEKPETSGGKKPSTKPSDIQTTGSTSPNLLNNDCIWSIFEFVGYHSNAADYFDFGKIDNKDIREQMEGQVDSLSLIHI